MSLEAQLLKIIEEQQHQLKEQQQAQKEALQLIQAQAGTINKLKNYTETLSEKNSEAVQVVKKYQQIVQKLEEQTISPHFSKTLEVNLSEQLQKQFKTLVNGLSIKSEVQEILPTLVTQEIKKQMTPLVQGIETELASVQEYHKKFEDLILEVSSRL